MKEGKVFKRILAIALVVVMTITMVPFGVFAAEGDTPTPEVVECQHNGEIETIKKVEPTCTETGHWQYYKCLAEGCGKFFNNNNGGTLANEIDPNKTGVIPALGHDETGEFVETKAPTCTEKGEKTKTCKREGCTEVVATEEIPEAAHNALGVVEAKAPTCTETGVKGGTYCNVCNNGKAAAEEVLPTVDHNTLGSVEAKAANCTEAGVVGGTYCTACNNGKEAAETVLPALGHAYGADGKCTRCQSDCPHTDFTVIPAVEAECEKSGWTAGKKCDDCGKTFEAPVYVEPLNHTEETLAAVAATCTTAGLTEGKKCSVCDKVLVAQEEVSALNHDWNEWQIDPATCTRDGSKTRTCKRDNCDAEETETIAKLAHTLTITEGKAATCTAKGNNVYYTCSACNNKFKDAAGTLAADEEYIVIDEIAHDYSSDSKKVLATCISDGYEIKKCSMCGVDGEKVVLPKNDNHDWCTYTQTVAPTCTEVGKKEAACKREGCTVKDVQDVAALGHDMDEIAAVEATCATAGNNKYYACDRCNKFFKDAEGAVETTEDAETIAKGEHKFTTYNVVKDATCTANAVEKSTCSVCNEATHERPMPGTMIAHSFKDYKSDGNATCKVDGTMTAVCEICKEAKDTKTEVDSHKTAPHTPDADGIKCTLCGAELVCLHTYSGEKLITKTPTCTTEGQKANVCSKCNALKPGSEETLAATGHAWDEGEVIKPATCKEKGSMKHKCNNKCGETKTEEIATIPHEYKEEVTHATCTEDGYSTFTCTMCGSHYVDKAVKAYGHMFDTYFYDEGSATCYADGTKTATCANGCGEKNTIADPGSKTDHEMTEFTVITAATCTTDGEEEAKCFYHDKCGYSELVPIDALGHDETGEFVEKVAATCTDKGLKEKTCKREGCSVVVATEEIPALGHDIAAEFTVDVAPTCTTAGTQSKHCSRCDYKESVEEIPASGHDYKPGEGTTATCTEPGKAVFVCSGCGDSYEEANVPALGHDYQYVSNGDATCQADGTKTGTCTRCGAKLENIPDEGSMLEHEMLAPEVTPATTENDGIITTKCKNCEYAEVQDIAKIDKIEIKYTSAVYDGKYKRPGLTITDAAGNPLVKGEDYVLDIPAKDECIEVGTYTYTIYFQGAYEGEAELSYKIVLGKPAKVVAKDTKQSYINLKWSTVKGADGYRVYVKTSKGGWKKLATVKGATTYKAKDLKAGTNYTFAVKAFTKNEDGDTIWAPEFTEQTLQTLPSKTSKVTVKTNKSAVKLTWKAVTGADGYRVYVKTAKGGWKTVATVNGKTTYTVKELKANTTYEYAIKAYSKTDAGTLWSNQYTTVKAKTAK